MGKDRVYGSASTESGGFTLVELLITMVVLAIMLAIGVPSFRSHLQNNRATIHMNELILALYTARSEAVKRVEKVSVCASADQMTCSGGTDWATGWILFTDESGTAGVKDGTDSILRVWEARSGSTSITSNPGVTFVQYLGNGRISGTADVTFTVAAPGCTGDNVRKATIAPTGRVSQLPRTACP